MSTLPLRAPQVPTLPVTGLARAVAVVLAAIDAFVEAQEMARAAHKKYPFADW